MIDKIEELKNSTEEKMNKAIHSMKNELISIRAGRANPSLLDRIQVEYYGVLTPLNQVGNISAPEPRLLMISPWDSKIINDIERAILKSDLGLNPTNDGKIIRLAIPKLTEERRKEIVKLIKKYGEQAKVVIRSIRREANELLKKMEKNSDITEDDLKWGEKDIQVLTDKYIEQTDKVIIEKEKEILEV